MSGLCCVCAAFKNLIGIVCFAHGFPGLFLGHFPRKFARLRPVLETRKNNTLSHWHIPPLAVAANENINPNMSNAFGLRPTNTRRAWPSSKWVCVCARVCVRSADFNLDYVPYENSMEMENNKNSVEHVQSGESSASVCVCMCVLSVWSTWRLQCLVSNETCCGKRLRERERQREIWLSVGHFDIFHLFVGILFGFGSCFRGLAARHNRLRLIPPQFSIKPTSRAPPKPCCKATALGSSTSSPPLMLPQFFYTFFLWHTF